MNYFDILKTFIEKDITVAINAEWSNKYHLQHNESYNKA